jgi:hypothetical protein
MPIKFRCQNCRQFLGISRAQAGMIVDCPSCGRSLRVPNLDGSVESLPAPEMDLQDSSLAKALDELASIGDNNVSSDSPEPQPVSQPAEKMAVIEPVSQPKPIAIEAPLPAEPVAPPKSRLGKSASRELESLAGSSSGGAGIGRKDTNHEWLSARNVFLLCCGIGIAALGIGYVAGRIGGATHDSAEQPPGRSDAPQNDRQGDDPFTTTASTAAIRGRITYKTADGGSLPDSGARIIVLPTTHQGEAKLSVAGFRVADSMVDFRVATATLKELGGGVAIADDEGNYELSLEAAGLYRVLVLSHYQSRDTDEAVEPELAALLATYFDRPTQLLGRLRYESSEVRYKGDEPITWDHSFGRAD